MIRSFALSFVVAGCVTSAHATSFSTENKVAFARQAFNDSVLSYNNAREVFPGNIVAGMFSFTAAEFLEIEAEEKRSVPEVSFTSAG